MNSTLKFKTAQHAMQDLHRMHFFQDLFAAGPEEKNA